MENKLIKFEISGKFAFFKDKINLRDNISYPSIHKPNIFGMLGSICGREGFSDFQKNGKIVSYIKEFNDVIEVSIIKKMDTSFSECKINDSTMLQITSDRSKVIQETSHLLNNPSFDIYLKIKEKKLYDEILNRLKNKDFIFEPNLGKSYFHCSINNVNEVEVLNDKTFKEEDMDSEKESIYIKSLFDSSLIETDSEIQEDYKNFNKKSGEKFRLPVKSSFENGMYIENMELSYNNFVSKENILKIKNFINTNDGFLYFV